MLPGTVDGMQHICYFRHALALDERRVKFLPEYAYGGSAMPPPSSGPEHQAHGSLEHGKKSAISAASEPPHTLEVWFAGTHSDMYANFCFISKNQILILGLEVAGMPRIQAWIVVGLHSGGWYLKLERLVSARHDLNGSSLQKSRLRSRSP